METDNTNIDYEKIVREFTSKSQPLDKQAIKEFLENSQDVRFYLCRKLIGDFFKAKRRIGYELLKHCNFSSALPLLLEKWTTEPEDIQPFIIKTIHVFIQMVKTITDSEKDTILSHAYAGIESKDCFVSGYSAGLIAEILGVIPEEMAEMLFQRGDFWLSENLIEILTAKNWLHPEKHEKIFQLVLSGFRLKDLNGRFLTNAVELLSRTKQKQISQSDFDTLIMAFKQLDEFQLEETTLKKIIVFLSELQPPDNSEWKRRIYYIKKLNPNHNIKTTCTAILEKIGYPSLDF